MKQIAIDAEFKRVEREKRRVGQPRFFCLQLAMERAHRSICKKAGLAANTFDMRTPTHRNKIASLAVGRVYPFHKKKHKAKKHKQK